MANSKISALTSATTPLAGTEVLPIVQSSTTKQVSVANLTAGRDVAAQSVALTRAATSGSPILSYTDTGGANNSYLSFYNAADAWLFALGNNGTGVRKPIRFSNNDYGNSTSGLILSLDPSTNNVTVNSGNLVIGTSGKGIDFSAVTHAGSTSKLLADYEEGTWTPTVTSASGTITSYTLTGANYTKTGRTVNVNVVLTITNAGTGAGALQITLPFTNGTVTACGVGRENALTGYELQASVLATSATMSVFTYANLTPIGTNAQIRLSMAYFV